VARLFAVSAAAANVRYSIRKSSRRSPRSTNSTTRPSTGVAQMQAGSLGGRCCARRGFAGSQTPPSPSAAGSAVWGGAKVVAAVRTRSTCGSLLMRRFGSCRRASIPVGHAAVATACGDRRTRPRALRPRGAYSVAAHGSGLRLRRRASAADIVGVSMGLVVGRSPTQAPSRFIPSP
jgi:hypothetical protein